MGVQPTLEQCDAELKAFFQKYGRRPARDEPGFRSIDWILRKHHGSSVRQRCDILELGGIYPKWKEIYPHLFRISSCEVDVLRKAILFGMGQRQIAESLSMTQAGISYQIQKSLERVRAWSKHPKLAQRATMEALRAAGVSPLSTRILWELYRTPNQSEVGERLGITQGKVRYRLIRAVELLKKANCTPYLQLFEDIQNGVIKAPIRYGVIAGCSAPRR